MALLHACACDDTRRATLPATSVSTFIELSRHSKVAFVFSAPICDNQMICVCKSSLTLHIKSEETTVKRAPKKQTIGIFSSFLSKTSCSLLVMLRYGFVLSTQTLFFLYTKSDILSKHFSRMTATR